MLARWYLLLGQLSVTFEYRPGAQHANADGMSGQCGQCQRPDCPVSAMDSPVPDAEPETEMVDQPFAASEMGESMDADLLPELSGETWVSSALIEEFTADLLPAGSNVDLGDGTGVDSVGIDNDLHVIVISINVCKSKPMYLCMVTCASIYVHY